MKNFKKVLAMAGSLVLTAAIAISGTVAYLQSEDSDVNVMTLGNVKIAQHEYERVVDENGNYTTIDVDGIESYELKEFTQAKPLYPFVGSVMSGYDPIPVRLAQLGHNSRGGMDVFPAKNVQDKFVVVENTGKSDAYVRTIVAFEAGSVAEEDWYKIISYSAHFTWKETQDWFVTEIGGNNYYLVEFVYNGYEDVQHPNGVLTPGDFTYNNLAQVYMFDTATNEDCEALDGNKNGTYDILVISQAVQAAGFDNAKTALDAGFGEFNEANVKAWFEKDEFETPKVVETAKDLQNAIDTAEEGKTNTIILGDDIEGDIIVSQPTDKDLAFVIDGQGRTYDGTLKIKGFSSNNGTDSLVIKNINFETSTANTDFIWSADSSNGSMWRYAHNVTIENCTFTAKGDAINNAVGARFQQAYNITLKNCTATNVHSLLQAESCGSTVTVDGCKVVNGKNGVSLNNTMNAIVKNCDIESVADGGYGIRHKGQVNGYKLTVENCNVKAFVPVLIRNMTGTGYTANFNGTNTLTATNTYGYQVVLANGDWDNDATAPATPTGSYTLTGANGFSVFGK